MVHIFFIAYVFYALFLLLEVHGGHWISRLYWEEKSFNHNQFLRGIVILTFLFLPFSYALKMYSSKRTFILFLGFSVVILLLILLKAQPSAARVAVLFAGLFFVMGHCYKKWRTFILISVGAYLVVAPFLFLHTLNRQTLFDLMHYLPSSYQHRIEIWNETSKHIRENLLIGHGFDHSSQFKEAPPRCVHHRTAEFDAIRTDETIISKTPYAWGGVVCYKDSLLTTHPHSGSLQIWLEFGLVGIGIVCFLLYKFIQYADAQIPLYRSYLYSLLGMGLVYWNVSFGLWQSWMIALVTLTFSLFQLIKSLPSNKKEDAHV
jgi:O-antigen ligase